MNEWKYINTKEVVENYNQSKFNKLESFLSDNYLHINGRNNANVSTDLVYNVHFHSYKDSDSDIIITRRKEFSYPLTNPNNEMQIVHDEIVLSSSDKKNIENFLKKLKDSIE